MTPEEFRRYGHRIVDWIADYRTRVGDEPVMSRAEPGSIRAKLGVAPPDAPESFEAVLRDLDAVVLPGISHWQHPRFFGYFPSNGELSSVLGDFLSTGLGVLGLSRGHPDEHQALAFGHGKGPHPDAAGFDVLIVG